MVNIKVKIKEIENAIMLVRKSEKCDFSIDIGNKRCLVDAKSINGILSLDLSKVYTLHINVEKVEECDKYLKEIETMVIA